MASLATVSQSQQRVNNSVGCSTWGRHSRVLSPRSDYRCDDKENGILSPKKEDVTDEEITLERQHSQFLTSYKDVETTSNLKDFLYDQQNFYQEGFLEKLSQLRMAHKKTLDTWQRLYEENLGKNKRSATKLASSSRCGQYPVHKVDIEYYEQDPIENIHCGSRVPADTYSNFPRKKPTLRESKSSSSMSKKKTVKLNIEKKPLPPQNTHYNNQPPNCYQSLEEESWKDLMDPRSVHDESKISVSNSENNVLETGLSDKSNSDHFSDVNTELQYGYNEDDVYDDGSWHHRLTIPEPFNMTKREEMNQKKKKSKTLLEYEKECEEKRKLEEDECSKMFKASPVPDHVFMPLYEEIQKIDDLRRSRVKDQTKEFLQSQEKPFSFAWEEKEKINEHRHHVQSEDETKKKTFKANPIPKHILDSTIDEKLIDDANLREMKRKIRSFELLRSSSIPKGMDFRQKLMEQKLKSKARETEKRHNPKIHSTVPDYDALYKQFQKDLMKKRKVKESTNVQPFIFRTNELVKQREKKKKELQYDTDSDVGSRRLRRSNSE